MKKVKIKLRHRFSRIIKYSEKNIVVDVNDGFVRLIQRHDEGSFYHYSNL